MNYRERINKKLTHYEHIKTKIKEEKEYITTYKNNVSNTELAQKILQEISEKLQSKVHSEICSVVSYALESIFENPYQFKIIFEQKRGKTEARLVFIREENELDPLKESGGGCVDIASLALRLSCLVLSRPKKRMVLILDEPFKGISKNYRHLVPELIETLSEKMDCQFIFVTNIKEYQCGNIINLEE